MINDMFRKLILIFCVVILLSILLARVLGETDRETKAKYNEDFFVSIAQEDPMRAQTLMEEKMLAFPDLAEDCHKIAHKIGRVALRRSGDFGQTVAEEIDICNSGYLHGVIEEYFNQHSDDLESIKNACKEYPEKRIVWQCNHGIGHGLMLISNNDIKWSLEFCESYAEILVEQRCSNGAFMEYFTKGNILTPAESFNFCDTAVKDIVKEDCYMYIPEEILKKFPRNYQKVLELCRQIKNADYRKYCIGGAGSVILRDNIKNIQLVKDICTSINLDDTGTCFSGAIWRHLSTFKRQQKTEEFCESLSSITETSCKKTIKKYDALVGL